MTKPSKNLKTKAERYAECRKAYRERRYGPTKGVYERRPWTDAEDELIIAPDKPPDRELAVAMHRSVRAIEARRARLREQGVVE